MIPTRLQWAIFWVCLVTLLWMIFKSRRTTMKKTPMKTHVIKTDSRSSGNGNNLRNRAFEIY